MPKVSVLTPIYNTNPEHLRLMIESILGQTFTDFEFLILNDSPDNTELERIVKSYGDARIKYIRNAENIGISASRNKLLKMASGEYVAIFDHDDISVPTRLAQQVAYLDTHPTVGVVSGWVKLFGDSTHTWREPETDAEIKAALTVGCHIAHTAAMIRKSVLADNGIEYEAEFSPAEDYRLWARLMAVTDFYNIQSVLVYYRWYTQNTSNQQVARMRLSADVIRFDVRNRFPAYYDAYVSKNGRDTKMYISLFGIIPLVKIKRNIVYLFNIIPILVIRAK